jgi:anaerobic selenocysteine-containing dehydrogenase
MTAIAPETRTAIRTCPLCEAGCGLEITLAGDQVTRIRGDREDVFSHGFICPKGSTLKQLHDDPDRLRRPLVKRDGVFEEVDWPEAFAEVDRRLRAVIDEHGRDAVAVYLGNPNAHNLDALLYIRPFIRSLGSVNVYSASTVDQRPKEIAAGLMFGGPVTIPVPDIDRTDHLLLLGANPFESNGSLATAPDWPGRIEALIARGGTLVVIDPRRTRTAEAATEHHFIRPGSDAHLLMAMVHVLFDEGLVDLGSVAEFVAGVDVVEELSRPFEPEAVARFTGIDAATTRRLARELATAPRAAVYGRIGTTTAAFGTVASWLVDVLNILTGNLDRPGGAMFAMAAAGAANTRGEPRVGRGVRIGRRHSRVRNLPESLGELPVVALAEEIETAGPGQVRALITVAGNPVLSTPDGGRLDRALAELEVMVSVDIYLNETTRRADVILPAPSPLQRSHYDLALLQLAVRNVTNFSPAVLPLDDGAPAEWQILSRLALILQGMGPSADPAIVDDLAIRTLVDSAVADETSPVHGREPEELLAALAPRTGPERLLDLMLRTGPYGDGFGSQPGGLTLDVLLAHSHGIDLGPLAARLPDALRTPTGMIELAPDALRADAERLAATLSNGSLRETMVLVGRRELRSNNSWMHNLGVLMRGRRRCTLLVHPDDASRLGLADGGQAKVSSRTGVILAPVEVTDSVMPGVVSIPHGYGHDLPGVGMAVAEVHAGVNSNLLADTSLFDQVSGTAVLNGIPVEVSPA